MLAKSAVVARKMQLKRKSMRLSLRELAAQVGCAHTSVVHVHPALPQSEKSMGEILDKVWKKLGP